MRRPLSILLLILLALILIQVPTAVASATDSTQSVNRLRVAVTTTSDWTHLYFPAGETVLNWKGSLTSGTAGIATVNSGDVFIAQNRLGQPATAQFDVLATTDGVTAGLWQITKGWGQRTHVDIYNINDEANPYLIASVDDTAAQGDGKTFIIPGENESYGGPLSAGNMGPRKVLAFYAPWWHYDSWDNPNKSDSPTTKYSVNSLTDVKRLVNSAAASGVDGFISSYQGAAFNDVTMTTLLEAARQNGSFNVSSYIETAVANSAHSESQPTDPAYMRQWITEMVQNYATSPNYLRYNGKPVIFIYRARVLSPEVWKTQVFDPLRAQGIDAFYMADYMKGDNGYSVADYMNVFDGMHSYNPSVYGSGIPYELSTNAIATKTYSLLDDTSAGRKLWMGTAVPGFDDSLIRPPGTVISRDAGNFYRSMWESNLATNPDWVMVTTWNDYGENTHIESSTNYGSLYLDLTRSYADTFRSGGSGGSSLLINNLSSSVFLPGGFDVSWQTSSDADALLVYGSSPGVYTDRVSTSTRGSSHRLIATGIQPGRYYAKVKSTGVDGSSTYSPEFQMVIPNESAPGLSIVMDHTYWADYASYRDRALSVDFRVTNSGPGDAVALEIIRMSASDGVAGKTTLPMAVGTVARGVSRTVSVKWNVPMDVGIFSAQLWAQATTPGGTRIYYPGIPTDQG